MPLYNGMIVQVLDSVNQSQGHLDQYQNIEFTSISHHTLECMPVLQSVKQLLFPLIYQLLLKK